MNDLPLFAEAKAQSGVTVSELTTKIKSTLEPEFNNVWVRGEISNFKPAPSGHLYFSLKDDSSMISAAFFGWGKRSLSSQVKLKDGLEVLCRGKISVYPPRGSYQIVVDHLEPLGAGALQMAFEQLKEKLKREGLFDIEKKRQLPSYVSRVAVVTSPTGAVVRDIINVMSRRAPHVRITVVPTVVQGADAHFKIIQAIKTANEQNFGDVIILARGGGSIEDLWCFNNEELARTIRNSKLPVISAVGHETDFTIADFVADLRAPTPSAAAEIVTAKWADMANIVMELKTRLWNGFKRGLAQKLQNFQSIARQLRDPRDRLRDQAQKCDDWSSRLNQAMKVSIERKKMIMAQIFGKLDALSPLKVLERGYTIIKDDKDSTRVIKRAVEISAGQKLKVVFHDGSKTLVAAE
ncbi:MAG: exodeoxyribonuclease VII large subunit [Xanthomonadaceae bacterium]|nr:exodeoxyribonuclease VII large subunit [Xanthomonadaceae bacterium]